MWMPMWSLVKTVVACVFHLISPLQLQRSRTVVVDAMAEVQVEPLEQILLVVDKLDILIVVAAADGAVLAALGHGAAADAVALLLTSETPSNTAKNRHFCHFPL